MTVNNAGLTQGAAGTTNALALMYNYQYDQLNRIVAMRAYQGLNEATNVWTPVAIDDYQEAVSYDANGNIKSYVRNGAPSIAGKQTLMDNLGYHYDDGTNQLNHVTDNVSEANYTEDIDGQDINNYRYDAIGNLIKDVSEGITDINWTVYGKIAAITKNSGNISYTYDAAGNRITKTAGGKTTLYVRNGSGNVMSVYEIPAASTINQKELHLYGSSRLGMALPESQTPDNSITLTSGFGNATVRSLVRAEKIFELSNHLGNMLVTVSDKKIQIPKSSPNQTQIDHYEVDVITATDYAPFGMQLFGRSYKVGSNNYRYGFNGKEKDTDIHSLTAYDYGFRIYNPALGKFLSVDPLTQSYPELTPYQFASNNPIEGVDLDGLEYVSSKDIRIELLQGGVYLKVENMTSVVQKQLIAYSQDPKNWASDGKTMGVGFKLGSLDFQKATTSENTSSDPDPSDANTPETTPPGEIKVENPRTRASNYTQEDKRYKQRSVSGSVPAATKGFAIASIAIDAVTIGYNIWTYFKVQGEVDKVKTDIKSLNLAIADVNYALKMGGIPENLQTEQYLSDITNVVLSGVSKTNNYDTKVGSQILQIGKSIYDTYSIKRNKYTGNVLEVNGQKIVETNPKYDPEYIKNNPPQ